MSKIVRVECKGVGVVSIDEVEHIQGDLKSLSVTAFERLKNQMLTHGFSAPFFLWKNPKREKWACLDGNMRLKVLKELRSQAYEVPKLPYVEIYAKSELEAKKKLLSYVSQFGKVDKQGLYQYIIEAELGIEDMDDFEIPEIDMDEFKAEYFDGLASEDEMGEEPDMSDEKEIMVTVSFLNELEAEAFYNEVQNKGLKCKLIT